MNIKDIALLAGVSTSTVSKIINNKADNIPYETKERVLRVVKENHYVPYANKGQKQGKTFCLALLLTHFANKEKQALLKGVLEACQKAGYALLLFDSQNSFEQEQKHLSTLLHAGIDGLIFEPLSKDSFSFLPKFEQKKLPVFHLKTFSFPQDLHIPYTFHLNYQDYGYQACQRLIEKGHSKPFFLFEDEENFSTKEMLTGFKKCLLENQKSFQNHQLLSVTKDIKDVLYNHQPTAFLATQSSLATELKRKLHALQIQCPRDFSLLSYVVEDDFFQEVAISSFLLPYASLGAYVTEKLIAFCEDQREDLLKNFSSTPVCNHFQTLDIPLPQQKKKALVIGSMNFDTYLLADELPHGNQTLHCHHSLTMPGGKAFNQAIGLAKLKQELFVVGKIGADYEGSKLLATLNQQGIDTLSVFLESKESTGRAYIHLSKNGESHISLVHGANAHLIPEDIEESAHLFEHSSICLLQTEIPLNCVIRATEIAKRYGVKTLLKPSGLSFMPLELFNKIDFLVLSENEANVLLPNKNKVDQANFFLNLGVEAVIFSGEKQSYFLKTKEIERSFPSQNTPILDETGTADAFISAFTAFYMEKKSLEESVLAGQIAGSFCASRLGVAEALIDKDSLTKYFLSEKTKMD